MSEATSGTLIQDPAFRYALAGYLLLHGFIKKTQKNPAGDLELAHKRRKEVT
jgi:phage-related protein